MMSKKEFQIKIKKRGTLFYEVFVQTDSGDWVVAGSVNTDHGVIEYTNQITGEAWEKACATGAETFLFRKAVKELLCDVNERLLMVV